MKFINVALALTIIITFLCKVQEGDFWMLFFVVPAILILLLNLFGNALGAPSDE